MSATAWRYRAVDARGAAHSGVIDAADRREALRRLTEQGLTATALEPAAARPPAPRPWWQRLGARERIELLQELAALLASGVPLIEALKTLLAAHRHTALAPVLERLTRTVQGGQPLAVAIATSGLALPPAVQALLTAGETAGTIAAALEDAAAQLERERQLRAQITTALIYPAVLIFAGLASVLCIFLIVVPRFAPLLEGRAEIPVVSRAVIEAGLWFQGHWAAAVFVLIALIAAAALLMRHPAVRARLWPLAARLPLVSAWLAEAELGRWAMLLSTLLAHRVPLIDALALTGAALRLPAQRARLARATDAVRRGRALAEALAEQGFLDPTRITLLKVGEASGELPRLTNALGRRAAEAAAMRLKRLVALIEPVAILLIGGAIGFLMVAVILAVTSLNTVRL